MSLAMVGVRKVSGHKNYTSHTFVKLHSTHFSSSYVSLPPAISFSCLRRREIEEVFWMTPENRERDGDKEDAKCFVLSREDVQVWNE